jgi:hypothetical protein
MSTPTNTATDTPLATLTSIECDAALASVEPGAPSVLQLAAQLKLSPRELLDILARPHVIAFADAARAFVQIRADILASYTHTASLQNLAEIAQNRDADVNMRLRAAIAILQGGSAPALPSSARVNQRSHEQPISPPRLRLPAPAKPPPASTASGAGESPLGTPTVPGGLQPDPHTNNKPTPAPTDSPRPDRSTPSVKPATLHRAVGAHLARHGHRVDAAPDCEIEHRLARCAASPARSGPPP